MGNLKLCDSQLQFRKYWGDQVYSVTKYLDPNPNIFSSDQKMVSLVRYLV